MCWTPRGTCLARRFLQCCQAQLSARLSEPQQCARLLGPAFPYVIRSSIPPGCQGQHSARLPGSTLSHVIRPSILPGCQAQQCARLSGPALSYCCQIHYFVRLSGPAPLPSCKFRHRSYCVCKAFGFSLRLCAFAGNQRRQLSAGVPPCWTTVRGGGEQQRGGPCCTAAPTATAVPIHTHGGHGK